MKKYFVIFIILAAFLVTVVWVNSSQAIPAFARKYKTSCTTCHTAFPKLNAFGRAFRNLGFQMPGGDEQYTKDKPVKMGADAWKYVFPKGVWPGDIPGTPPVAFRISGAYVLNTQNTVEQDFKIPSGLNILSAGTLSKDITFYIGIHLFDDGDIGFLNRAYIQFDNLLDRWLPDYALNIRVGQFLPDLLPFAIHRGLMNTKYFTNSVGFGGEPGEHHGGAGSLEQAQRGIEIKGILNHRFQYAAGLVNGNGIPSANHETGGNFDDNNFKDGYFRIAYKLGGMGFDGSDPNATEGVLKDAENWRDNSIRLGAFAYLGNATAQGAASSNDHGDEDAHDEGDAEKTDDFNRIGFDIDAYIGDFNLFGAYSLANEKLADGDEITYNSWFVQCDYVLYPWLLPGIRYEKINPEKGSATTRIVPNITALVRANIKTFVEMRINPDEFDKNHIDLMVGLDFAF